MRRAQEEGAVLTNYTGLHALLTGKNEGGKGREGKGREGKEWRRVRWRLPKTERPMVGTTVKEGLIKGVLHLTHSPLS